MASNLISCGMQDYKRTVGENGPYIDKTRFIETLERFGSYNIFLRPRRFGKSLMASMLHYYYDIRYKDEFDSLFGNTHIGKNKTDEANTCMVMDFSFAGISPERTGLEGTFDARVKTCLNRFIRTYGLGDELTGKQPAAALLRECLNRTGTVSSLPIYVLIDDYDHFAHSEPAGDKSPFLEITPSGGFVQNFYAVFKDFSGSTVRRMFITGVTPITLDCLTSGFNICTNISNELMFNEMAGFTDEEARETLGRFSMQYEEHEQILEKYCGGYKFCRRASKTVYSPDSILFYVRHFLDNLAPPDDRALADIDSDTNGIAGVFSLYDNEGDKREILEKIVSMEPISGSLKQKFENDTIASKDEFISMLCFLGFLTITGERAGRTLFATPNCAARQAFQTLFR